jgi:hypothetical protein
MRAAITGDSLAMENFMAMELNKKRCILTQNY